RALAVAFLVGGGVELDSQRLLVHRHARRQPQRARVHAGRLLPAQRAETFADLVVEVEHVGNEEAQPEAERGKRPRQQPATPARPSVFPVAVVVELVFVVIDAGHGVRIRANGSSGDATMEGVAVESSAAPGARRRHGRPPFSERNRIVPDALTYHLRRLGSRLHRARITLHGKGLHGFLRRALQGASPGPVAPAGPRPATAPRQPAPGGKRILLVDTTTPRPDRDSGSLRAFNLMRLLLEEGHAVDFLPDDRADAGRYTDDLRELGVTVHCGPDAGGDLAWFRRHLPGFDALIVSRYHLGEFLIPLARTVAPRVRVVLDTVDLHFLREQREAELRGDRTLAR